MAVTRRNRFAAPTPAIALIVVDSTSMGAQLVADALKREHFAIICSGSNVDEAVSNAHRADIALLLVGSDQQCHDACNLARKLHAASKRLEIILVKEDVSRDVVVEALRSGIRGIFSQVTSVKQLRRCILAVNSGQLWIGNKELVYVVDALIDSPSMRLVDAHGIDLLSRREADVVRCVSEGLTNREIADRLKLSENTVKNYLFRIFDKLGISSRVELTLYAVSKLAEQQRDVPHPDPLRTEHGEIAAPAQLAVEQLMLLIAEIRRNRTSIHDDDPVGAYMWLLIAGKICAIAQQSIRDSLVALRSELTAEQVVQAERAADRWLGERGLKEEHQSAPTIHRPAA